MEGRWQRAQQLYESARKLDTDARRIYLSERCGDDRSLREAVEALLRVHDETREDREAAATVGVEEYDPYEQPPEIGERIGPYVIRRLISEGGFGRVYMAERVEPMKQVVALKVIKPGLGSREVLARFDTERQALALMQHPNIARVFDAGKTRGGRPYFVMEYVPGEPITDHCDRHRLSVEERLELFRQVGDAVQHAHQRGIIHRDLKPNTILVSFEDGRAVPKVIDFGIAKALTPLPEQPTLSTEYGRIIGTPEYMAPEQIDPTRQDIDTRADIYALGVLLYQLLTGTLPVEREQIRGAALEARHRLVWEYEPPPPSHKLSTLGGTDSATSEEIARRRRAQPRSLTRQLRGDLDWITMKCLEKDRSRRYGTAAALAADIRRHQNSEPCEAGPPSA